MFSFNNKYYIKYCKCCFFFSEQSVMRFSYTDTLQTINRYPTPAINPSVRKIKVRDKRDSFDKFEDTSNVDYHLMSDTEHSHDITL